MSAGPFVAGVAGVLGLAIGSFLNVVAYRVPAGISLLRQSRCPSCDQAIAPWRNVPVLGWLMLGGRCASCKAPISARYPLVEALSGLAFTGVTLLWWSRLRTTASPTATEWVVLSAACCVVALVITLSLIAFDAGSRSKQERAD